MGLGGMWERVRGSLQEQPHNLLAISDLHLGADLKPGARPSRRGFDLQLAEFLDWHAANRKNGIPWRLILNGDIVDFVAITVTPGPEAEFEVRPEERQFGLAAEESKCVWKLRKTFDRHPEVFDALARFLHKGNLLHIVRGNHDSEFHWPAVQAEFNRQLVDRLGLRGAARRRVEERIQFHPWFYLEPGFLYAEHGNAHDHYSVQSGFFDPAGVNRELELPLSSQVLRYFPTGKRITNIPIDAGPSAIPCNNQGKWLIRRSILSVHFNERKIFYFDRPEITLPLFGGLPVTQEP